VTKKGDKMAILQLEDLTHQIKAVVFPKTYEQVERHIIENAILLISGKIEKDGEEIQIIVDDAKPIEAVETAEEINPDDNPQELAIEDAWLPEPVKFVQGAKPVEVLQMVIVKFTPQQVKNVERLKYLKAILQELSNRGEGASVSVGGIVVGQYSCQPFRISSQLWVQDGEETISRLKSAGFEASVFPLNNHADVLVFREMRSQLNLHSWASRLLDTNPDRINRYLHYLSTTIKVV
jgi:DNA polymerase-3 subunit alpha